MNPALRVSMHNSLHSEPSRPTAATPLGSSGGFDVAWATRGIGRGDARAFEILYRAWFGRVYGFARGLTKRDEAFCLDVTQEVMLRAARKMPEIESEQRLAAWLSRATLSAAVDLVRRERRASKRAAKAASARPAAADNPQRDELGWLARSFGELTEVDQALLMQRIAHGSTLKEAAAAVGIGEQAAHGRVRRALARLRELAREVLS
jgi:RNA polymerase sigma factor (sigma-70 family)